MRISQIVMCIVFIFSAFVSAEPNDPNVKRTVKPEQAKKETAGENIIQKPRQMQNISPQQEKEYMLWIEKNMPQISSRLGKLKDTNSKMYQWELRRGVRRLSRLQDSGMDNADIIHIFKEENRLDEERDILVKKIKEAGSSDEKQKLISELEKVINSKYDLMIKQKEMMCEQFQKRVQNLQKSLDENKADVERLKDSSVRSERTKRILQRLLESDTSE